MKTAVLLSGGVDSSVALRMLQEEGADLTAYYLKVWLEDEVQTFAGDCPWEEDMRFVRATCEAAGVPLQIVSLQTEYYERIVEHVLAELRAGRTPSPDIFCNRRIKFGAFLERVGEEADVVASGHYARLETTHEGTCLLRAADPVKDQTYFLSHMAQAQLHRARFPIGHLPKAEVRRLAHQYELPSRDRKDSQGICFLGKIDYRQFVEFHLGQREGAIVDADTGQRLGTHLGYWFYTIGQRFGLGLSGGPWYVVGKDLEDNTLSVAHADRREARSRSWFEADGANWIDGPPGVERLQVKLRHGPQSIACTLAPLRDDLWRVDLDETDGGIAPGQHAVFYDGELCLGGAVIR
ncbi:MAG: tRNA 2-thiouridine(34) synthase MnmA [Candidatus Latescibacterota bacterium]